MSYYDEVIQEIRTAVDAGDAEEARFLLKRELSMPYIPQQTEAELKNLEREVNYRLSNKREAKEDSLDHLLHKLKGKPESQLSAVNALADRNLRSISNEIRDWLSKDPQPEAAVLMIELLAEQGVAEEFTITRNGVEYEFYGDAVTPVAESAGFRRGYQLLSDWFAKEPSLFELARTVLVSKCCLALPLSYEAEEAEELALSCAKEVLSAMGMEKDYQAIEAKCGKIST